MLVETVPVRCQDHILEISRFSQSLGKHSSLNILLCFLHRCFIFFFFLQEKTEDERDEKEKKNPSLTAKYAIDGDQNQRPDWPSDPDPASWLAVMWSTAVLSKEQKKKNPNKNQNQEVIGSAGHLQWPLFTHVYRTVFQKRTKRWKGNKIELNKQTASECWVLFQSNWTVSRLNRFFFRVNFENQGQILGKKLLKHLFEYKTNQTQSILLLFTSLTVFLGLCVSVCVHNILITTNIRTENVNVKLWVNVVFHLLGFILVHCEQQKKKKILIWFF